MPSTLFILPLNGEDFRSIRLNGSGKSVAPNAASIAEALERAQWANDSNAADLDGSAGPGAYPMVAVPYALLPANLKPTRKSALPFIQTSVAQGDAQIKQVGFLPLPAAVKMQVNALR